MNFYKLISICFLGRVHSEQYLYWEFVLFHMKYVFFYFIRILLFKFYFFTEMPKLITPSYGVVTLSKTSNTLRRNKGFWGKGFFHLFQTANMHYLASSVTTKIGIKLRKH